MEQDAVASYAFHRKAQLELARDMSGCQRTAALISEASPSLNPGVRRRAPRHAGALNARHKLESVLSSEVQWLRLVSSHMEALLEWGAHT